MSECGWCGSTVPEGSRFCLECGRPLGAEAARGEGVSGRLRARLQAPAPLTLIALAIAAGGVILLAGGVWAWGVVALLCAAVLALLPGRVDRAGLLDAHRRLGAARAALAVRGRGEVGLFRVRRELADLEANRGRLYHELGRAVYAEDEPGTTAARTALDAVCDRIRTKEAEIATLIHETEERVRRVRGPVQPTQVLHDEAPPQPPSIPEPWPPPDEGDIPEPPQPGPDPAPGPAEPEPEPQPPSPGLRGDRG